MELSEKEMTLLKELKEHEQLCVDKYTKYASEANDAQLKKAFAKIMKAEKQHLDTITKIMGGNIPTMPEESKPKKPPVFTQVYKMKDTSQEMKDDKFLCTDLLSTEKHVSSLYDTCVFEFKDTNIRNLLNHIQKEEQQHGEQLYSYMATNGMYN